METASVIEKTGTGEMGTAKRKSWPKDKTPPEPSDPPTCPDHGCELLPYSAWSEGHYEAFMRHGDRPPPEVYES